MHSPYQIKLGLFVIAPAQLEEQQNQSCAGDGGGAVEGGVGLPVMVFPSISSTRVPSGSYMLNVAADHPDIVRRLRSRLEEIRNSGCS
jgi:hypothetical protein